jgi:hypothetical protein
MTLADLQQIIQENRSQRERLISLMKALRESDFAKRQPNGWTVGVALVHIAFWDLRQVTLLTKWLEKGGEGPVVPLDPDAINAPLAVISEAIPPQGVVKLATEASEKSDNLVADMTQAQVDEFLKGGSERFLRRALHRREHLDKIEKALGKG